LVDVADQGFAVGGAGDVAGALQGGDPADEGADLGVAQLGVAGQFLQQLVLRVCVTNAERSLT
jgi:hypothetical protein